VDNRDPGRNPSPAGRPERKRARFKSDLLLPASSVFVPGLGHYIQGDFTGLAYSAVAAAGVGLVVHAVGENRDSLPEAGTTELFESDSWRLRRFILGGLIYQGAGFMGAYSAFRLAVPRLQEEEGKYGFLGPPRESAGDLLIAPFRFDHLRKQTTWVPIGAMGILVSYLVYEFRKKHIVGEWTLSGDDHIFGGMVSYNAGVSEEAAFRGWIFPMAYQYTGEKYFLSNGAQALLFSAMHYDRDDLPVPWPQFLMGYYLGWLTRRNEWSLSEAIFIHSWWDMILLAGAAATNKEVSAQTVRFGATVPIPW
jgi:membrane protease YdiL (CAAX protease family)